MLNCAGARRALHAAFTLNAGAPLGFSPWVGWDKQGSIRSPVSGHGHPFSVNMDASVDSNHNPTRTALLIPGPDNASTVRGEGITNALSSRGFTIRVVRTEEGQEGSAGLSHEALLKLTVSSASSAMVFDLGGRGGQALALACKEAGAAGLYAFRPAVGMFQKVLGAEGAPSWIDPLVGSSYEQILNTRGWGFLGEDESEPRFAFDLAENGPWERAREERAEKAGEDPRVSSLGFSIDRMTDEEVDVAASGLTKTQRRVLLEGGTDQPDTIDNNASAGGGDDDTGVGVEKGVFICALGGLPLFLSEDSLSSLNGVTRRGWPGFSRPVHPDHLILREEAGPLKRTEVLCARSGAHLGHVFDDGPPPTGQRFCINRSSLQLLPPGSPLPRESRPLHRGGAAWNNLGSLGEAIKGIDLEVATFAGGCFWHVRDDFLAIAGVHDASCGYCGQIEAVRVLFDPVVKTYADLTKKFFDMHDPTTGDRQGNDWAPQYQAALFPHSRSQEISAQEAIASVRSKLVARALDSSSRPATTEKQSASPAQDSPEIAPDAAEPRSLPKVVNTRGGVKETSRTLQAAASSFVGEGEATVPVWWEGDEVRTVVVPTPEGAFVPDDSEREPPGE